MTTIKTAISLQKTLFEQINEIAQELKVSRSRLFVLAIESFIERYKNQRLLENINAAYADSPSSEEEEHSEKMRSKHRHLIEEQW
ncbi:hypothetical protein QUF64_12130 [Anaerolineales bacterium HSG6]|nr:hypothetical protein [Anaerolineales bacterium HSG6]MDM8531435.1 hypothetical protein [Anaerolineales bacterium HSG25]